MYSARHFPLRYTSQETRSASAKSPSFSLAALRSFTRVAPFLPRNPNPGRMASGSSFGCSGGGWGRAGGSGRGLFGVLLLFLKENDFLGRTSEAASLWAARRSETAASADRSSYGGREWEASATRRSRSSTAEEAAAREAAASSGEERQAERADSAAALAAAKRERKAATGDASGEPAEGAAGRLERRSSMARGLRLPAAALVPSRSGSSIPAAAGGGAG
uniref:Uncharacterized protein n=1 Tax=Triticum urartu TaxID=4572 RepID=A0A8R7RCL7_TRIUA